MTDQTSVEANMPVPAETEAMPAGEAETPPGDAPEPEAPKSALEKELEKTKSNPPDFNQWVALEKMTESEKSIEVIRQVYDALLADYPLCYGYWKKYADAEQKHGSVQMATEVFQRGTTAVPYSVDLWGHFCTFKQKNAAPASDVRKTFEDGIAFVGTDYLAHGLWDKYIKFETEQGTTENIANLYSRILECPLKELERYHSSLETFAAKHQAPELLSVSAISELRQAVFTMRQAQQASAESEAVPNGSAAEAKQELGADVEMINPSGDLSKSDNAQAEDSDAPPGIKEDALPDSPEGITDQEVKSYWLKQMEALYEETKKELARRRKFDTVIKRPYFHVKPLPSVQLHAWNAYLDYILTKEDPGTIVRLFERCLVACATYPEFWMRFLRYTEATDPSNVLATLQRPLLIFCKNDVAFNIFAAKFQERSGDIEGARQTYKRVVEELAPKLVSAVLEASSFERRQNNLAAATKLFDDLLASEETTEGGEQKGPSTAEESATVAVFYARFLHVDCQAPEQARVVFQKALEKHASLRFLWEAAIHFEEYSSEPGRADRVIELYKKAIAALKDAKTASESDLETLSQQMVDFADRMASPQVAEILRAEHFDKYNPYKETSSTKRGNDSTDQGPSAKRAKTSVIHTATGGGLPAPPQAQHVAYPPVASAPVAADPYAAQAAYPAAAAYSYDQYYQQYPGYAGYQYGY